MNIGQLDIQLTVEAPADQDQNANWSPNEANWTMVQDGKLWAKLNTRPGRTQFQAGLRENMQSVEFLVRWDELQHLSNCQPQPNQITNWRVSYEDGGITYIYYVTDAIQQPQYGRGRYGIISAQSQNPQGNE